jgi:RND family efflux transporter MFP subunit
MKKFPLLIIPIIIFTLVFGCSRDEEQHNNTRTSAIAERNVRIAEAVRKDFYAGIETTGRIQSDVYVNIAPSINGKIDKIHVREGDVVSKGDLLLELDDLNLIQAEQNYQNLERNYWRMSELFRNDAIDQQSFEEIETAYQIAKRNFEYALENTRIKAPIDGKIVTIALKEGENYTPMSLPALVKILSLTRMKAVTQLSDRDYARTEIGMRATARVDALPDKALEGYVSFISSEADPYSGTFRCEIIIEEENSILRHNQFTRIFISTDEVKNAVVVPAAAILNNNTAYVVKNNRAIRREVETGISSNIEVEVISGIAAGDQVIILGNIGLTDNYPVNIID